MWNLENNVVEATGIPYSRYIASWRNVGNKSYDEWFVHWLVTEGLCTDKEASEIQDMATCGKLELEKSAKAFNKDKERRKKFIKEYYGFDEYEDLEE